MQSVLRRRLSVAPEQTVEERGLAHARRTDDAHRDALAQVLAHGVQAVGVQRADRVNRDAHSSALQVVEALVERLADVGLVQQQHRRRAAVPNGGKVSLHATDVEVVIQTQHDEHDVDVGGDHLIV